MKNSCEFPILTLAALLTATFLLAPMPGLGQAATDSNQSGSNATPLLTLLDRQGKVVRSLGERAIYAWPSFSPDGKRLAVAKRAETARTSDIWVFDLSTGASIQLTTDPANDVSPVWSADGSQIVYASNPGGSFGLYRRAANGTGNAELLYQHPVAFQPTDWSADGRFLTFYNATNLYLLSLSEPVERKAVEVLPSQFRALGGRFSPDSRFLAYRSEQSGRTEIWVRRLAQSADGETTPEAGPWQISDGNGGRGLGMIFWRQDGKEIYYMAGDGAVMAVEVSTAPAFTFGKPRLLFKAPDTVLENPVAATSASRDGQQFLFAETTGRAQRARANAERFEREAGVLTVFDREGKTVGTIGERGLYNQPAFSPDRTRLAVIKNDLTTETVDVWVMDSATGEGTRITSSKTGEMVRTPTWSPDGSQVAYVALRDGNEGLYRKASNGGGAEELLYKLSGSDIQLTDWSLAGRFLSYYSLQLGGNILYALPLDGIRQPVELLRSPFQVLEARISPDNRFMAYRSNETGKNEIFVRAFNPTGAVLPPTASGQWQVSDNEGGLGLIFWKRDGTELYYLGGDRGVKAVSVGTTPAFEFGKPRTLFKLPDSIPVPGVRGALGNIARDGERVVFAVPPPPPPPTLQQITVFDRQGRVVSKVGEPGLYSHPELSPDGTRLAVLRNNRGTGTREIWTLDIATGKSTLVANDVMRSSPLWSPDGRQVHYASTRGNYPGVYRKSWNGTGSEELLFRHTPGAALYLKDISPDGKLVSFNSGNVVYVVALTGTDPLARNVIEFSREEFNIGGGRFSPDSRYLAYESNESGRIEIYVRSFDTSTGTARAEGKWQVSKEGARRANDQSTGGTFWRSDGKEMYFLAADPQTTTDTLVMAADVNPTPTFQSGMPRLLFKLPGPLQYPDHVYITQDGERFVFAINATADAPAR